MFRATAEVVRRGPKCILLGVLNQSRRRIHSLLIIEGLNTRKKSRVYLRLFQDVQYFCRNKKVEMKSKFLK